MKNKIVELIAANVEGLTAAEIADLIEIPPKPELGDFAFPCFRLAKTMRKAPQISKKQSAMWISCRRFRYRVLT